MRTIIQRSLPSIKHGVRRLSMISSDSNNGKPSSILIWPSQSIKENSVMGRDSNKIQSELKLISLTNTIASHQLPIFQPNTIELSASFYSTTFNKNLLLQNNNVCKDDIFNLKTSNNNIIELPNEAKNIKIEDPSRKSNDIFYINPFPNLQIIGDPLLPNAAKIEEGPKGPLNIEKQARRQSRMLKIRKKKMKVHRRKRLWKRMWATWKKKFFHREKNREIAFRHKLMDKVRAAEKFNPEAYVDDYLEDFKFELTPKTYQRKSKPQWLIKQLLERDEQVARRKHLNNTNILTNEPLIRKGETVEEFVKRNWK